MIELEKDAILPPRKPKLHKCLVRNIFTRRKTNISDQLLEFLNNCHLDTCEINSEVFWHQDML